MFLWCSIYRVKFIASIWSCNNFSSSLRLPFANQSFSDCLFLHRIASSISLIVCVTCASPVFFSSLASRTPESFQPFLFLHRLTLFTVIHRPTLLNFLVKGLKGPERRRSLSLVAPVLLNDTSRDSTIGVQRENKCKNSERHMERSLYNTNGTKLTNVQFLLTDLRQFHP